MSKVIIVTGASSGIGKATALQLIKEGHTVYGAARRVQKMQDLVSAGGNAIAMDVCNHEQVHNQIQKIIENEGKIDVLVNNAGYAVYGPVEEINYEQAKRQFDVNLFGLAEDQSGPTDHAESEIWNHHQYILRWRQDLYTTGSLVSCDQTRFGRLE